MEDGILEVVGIENLARLSNEQRKAYYIEVCKSVGLNPLTKPFDYLQLGGKMILYARKDATDQLRRIHNIDLSISSREIISGVYIVTAKATMPGGRSDESTGAVFIDGIKGEPLANTYMKAETKAKRRVTLSIVGLGWLDESEVSSIPDAQQVGVDTETGELTEEEPTTSLWTRETAPPVRNTPIHNVVEAMETKPTAERPYDAERTIAGVSKLAARGSTELAPEGLRGATVGAMEALFVDNATANSRTLRYSLLKAFFGEDTSKGLTSGQCKAILRWCQDTIEGEDGTKVYLPDERAAVEAGRIIEMVERERGQQELPIEEEE